MRHYLTLISLAGLLLNADELPLPRGSAMRMTVLMQDIPAVTLRIPKPVFRSMTSPASNPDSNVPTVMAGAFLSLALITGGLWLARKRESLKAGVSAGLFLALLVWSVSMQADIRGSNQSAEDWRRARRARQLRSYSPGDLMNLKCAVGSIAGDIQLEVPSEGSEIELIIPTGLAQPPDPSKAIGMTVRTEPSLAVTLNLPSEILSRAREAKPLNASATPRPGVEIAKLTCALTTAAKKVSGNISLEKVNTGTRIELIIPGSRPPPY